MDLSTINNVFGADFASSDNTINNGYKTTPVTDTTSFSGILNSMMGMVSDTNSLVNAASAEEIKFALGQSDNTHDLLIAQQKANIALQYTVSVRDKMIAAYKEIMQMQI